VSSQQPDWLTGLSGHEFETLGVRLLEALGWEVMDGGRPGQGFDIVARSPEGLQYVIELKASKSLRADALYRLAAQQKLHRVDRALLVTSREVTSRLTNEATALEIEVWGPDALARRLDEHPTVGEEFLAARVEQALLQAGDIKLHTLSIQGFRGVRQLHLDLPQRGATVLAGINGAGKSTVLAAIATGFSWLLARLANPEARGRSISDYDINNRGHDCFIELSATLDGRPVTWSVTGSLKGTLKPRAELDQLNESVRSILLDLERNPSRPLPLVVMYTVNRAVLDIPKRIRKRHEFDRFSAYDGALKLVGKAEFRTFFEWFREREDLENENRLRSPEHRDAQLAAVRAAIETLLENVSGLRVRRNPQRMVVDKDGEELIVDQLSDGEKCLLATVGDLARRLAIASPDSTTPLRGQGVVLIDEVDLHLHPRWQRRVVSALQRTFPNCQFIVTTHSPQVLSHVKEDAVLLGRDDQGLAILAQRSIYGWDTNRILEEFLEVDERPREVKEKLDGYFRAIQTGALQVAEQTRKELEDEIGSDEPSFKKADVLIRHQQLVSGK